MLTGTNIQRHLRLEGAKNAFVPRLAQRCRRGSSTVRRFQENKRAEEQMDFYEVLELSPDCDAEQIKAQYRHLQKLCHPDISGNEDSSVQLNEAYATLSDPALKARYDQRLRNYRVHHKGELRRPASKQHGVVGPVESGSILASEIVKIAEGSDCVAEGRKLVVWLREWAKTFMFAADLPLPTPVQCDDIEGGVRLAVIEKKANVIETLGELLFTIHQLEDGNGFVVESRRISMGREGPIPGESRLMRAFFDAMRDRSHPNAQKKNGLIKLSGIAAAAFAQLMPAIIPLPFGNPEGGSYEGYHLKHSIEDSEWKF